MEMPFAAGGGPDPAGCKVRVRPLRASVPSPDRWPHQHCCDAQSLYVGNLHPYVNEAMLQEIFSTLGPVLEVKVIKDKVTGMSAGYGFVKFLDHRVADLALQTINGRVLYGQVTAARWQVQKAGMHVGCRRKSFWRVPAHAACTSLGSGSQTAHAALLGQPSGRLLPKSFASIFRTAAWDAGGARQLGLPEGPA